MENHTYLLICLCTFKYFALLIFSTGLSQVIFCQMIPTKVFLFPEFIALLFHLILCLKHKMLNDLYQTSIGYQTYW